MSNGETLDQLEKTLDELLENPNAEIRDMVAGCLRVQRFTIPYLRTIQQDHDKLARLEWISKISIWFLSAVGILVIGLLWAIFTGQAQITFQ